MAMGMDRRSQHDPELDDDASFADDKDVLTDRDFDSDEEELDRRRDPLRVP